MNVGDGAKVALIRPGFGLSHSGELKRVKLCLVRRVDRGPAPTFLMKKLSVLFALSALAAGANASIVFDSITGISGYTYTGSTPRNMIGMAMNLGGPTGTAQVTGMDFAFVTAAAAIYTNVRFDVTFFQSYSGATTGASAAFASPLASYFLTTGAFTGAANSVYTYGATASTNGAINLGTGFSIADGAGPLGVQILARVDKGDGLGYVSDSNLTLALRTTSAPAVGTFGVGGANGGFYRNASSANPTSSANSLLGSDYRSFTGTLNTGMALRVYTTPVPEPASMVALGLGAAAVLRRRKKA